MKFKSLYLIVLFILMQSVPRLLAQQPTFKVSAIEGTAKVQHPQQHQWDKLGINDAVLDNDLIETNFQTKLTLQFTSNCIVILGSNSKILLKYKVKPVEDSAGVVLNVTLFNGGVLTKTNRNSPTTVYTTNAVSELDSGTLTIISDEKTGETGIQVLNGNASIKNIIQSKGKILQTGLTSMVLPNMEPTAPLYMTNRHVVVLKNFFGAEYIQTELDIAGVKPTEDRTGSRLSVSQNIAVKKEANADDKVYHKLFSLEKIYGSIVDDQLNNSMFYHPLERDKNGVKKSRRVEIGTDGAALHNNYEQSYSLFLSYQYRFIDAGLRFALSKAGASNTVSMDFRSAQSIFDKINYLTLGSIRDSMYIKLGPIDNFSCGHGLIVDDFSNRQLNNIYNQAGLNGQINWSELSFKCFLNDVTTPTIGGAYFKFEPSTYYLAAGYYFDWDQHKSSVRNDNFAYSPPLNPDSIKKGSRNGPLNIYELDFGTDVALSDVCNLRLFGEFAQKIHNGNDGVVLRLPSILVDLSRISFGFGLVMEYGRLISSEFDPFYVSQKSFVKVASDSSLTLESPNSVLSKDRNVIGGSLFFKANPFKGTDIAFSYKQNVKERNTFLVITDSSDTSYSASPDYSYSFRFAVNDSLVPFLKYAGIYVRQNHVTLFPGQGSPMLSWNCDAGVDIQTVPLFYSIGFEASCRYFYLDNSARPNNLINVDDHITEWYFGIKWGF